MGKGKSVGEGREKGRSRAGPLLGDGPDGGPEHGSGGFPEPLTEHEFVEIALHQVRVRPAHALEDLLRALPHALHRIRADSSQRIDEEPGMVDCLVEVAVG